MIAGIGIDLVDVASMERSIQSPAFLRRVFSAAELADCPPHQNRAQHLAGKFAAKEAFMKAVGKGIRQGLWFSQVQLLHDGQGQPYLQVSGAAECAARELTVASFHVSICHTRGMVTATVILER